MMGNDTGDETPANSSPAAGRRAVFVALDGALIERCLPSADVTRFVEGAPEALSALHRNGFALVVVTHQSGLALGYISRSQLTLLEATVRRMLHEEAGVTLTDFMVCPHRPGIDGRPGCLCRAPAPGLLIRAARAHRLDLATSWMVGDSLDHVEAGRRGGCRAGLLRDDAAEAPQRLSPLRVPHCRCATWAHMERELLGAARDGAAALGRLGTLVEPRSAGFA